MNGAPIGMTTATTGARRNETRSGRRAEAGEVRGAARGGIILKLRARRRVRASRRSFNTRTMVSESRGPCLPENAGAVRLLHGENQAQLNHARSITMETRGCSSDG